MTTMAVETTPEYPVRLNVPYPESVSRWLVLVKFILAIPHYIVVYFLQLVQRVVTLIAFFAILFTAKYPEGLFKFSVGVMRWQANVTAYVVLLRDEYPPFSFDAGQYPVAFDVAYPEKLSRWLIFIKWLLVIPHLIVLLVLGIAAMVTTLIAFFAILFTKRYPQGLFDFSVGVQRWSARVSAYFWLLTDAYPPFSLKP